MNPFVFSPLGRSVPALVHIGAGGVTGAADNLGIVAVPADSPVVRCTPFAPRQPFPLAPDGVARVSLSSCQMVRVFLGRCAVGPSGADHNAAAGAHPFNARLNADAWSRILSMLLDSGGPSPRFIRRLMLLKTSFLQWSSRTQQIYSSWQLTGCQPMLSCFRLQPLIRICTIAWRTYDLSLSVRSGSCI